MTGTIVLTVAVLLLQSSESLGRMQAAIEKQRASVRRQVRTDAGGSFFTTGWLDDRVFSRVHAACEPVSEVEMRKIIAEAAVKESVNPLLLRAMIDRESGGRPCAVSSKGAEGLMQLMPGTAADLGVRDSFDAAENLMAGARYIRQMLDRYKGDVRLALAAYNAGPQRVDEAGGVPPIAETQAYVTAILSALSAGP